VCVGVCPWDGTPSQTDVERVETRREPAFPQDGSESKYRTICYVRFACVTVADRVGFRGSSGSENAEESGGDARRVVSGPYLGRAEYKGVYHRQSSLTWSHLDGCVCPASPCCSCSWQLELQKSTTMNHTSTS
jgi:hypothetical protein